MKKKFCFLITVLALNLSLFSCSKDDDEEEKGGVETVVGNQYEISILTTTNDDPYRPQSAKTSSTTKQFKTRKEAEDYIANLRSTADSRGYVIDSQYEWHHITYGFKSYVDTRVQIQVYPL